jgi:hypothetical protein
MANEFFILSEDYQVEQDMITRPIYERNIIRQGLFPIYQEADVSDKQSIHYAQLDDLNWAYLMEPMAPRMDVGVTPVTTDVPVIGSELSYSVDELRRINGSKIPYGDRVRVMQENLIKAELAICLAGTTQTGMTHVVSSVSTTGTNSTACSANATVTDFQGDLIDNFDTIGDYPLYLVMTNDVYKVIRGVTNTYYEGNLLDEYIRRLRSVHPASGVFSTNYLGGTVTAAAGKVSLSTDGTTNMCLFQHTPQHYGVQTSPLDVRADSNPLHGLTAWFLERFRPIYKEKKAIIYDSTVTIA